MKITLALIIPALVSLGCRSIVHSQKEAAPPHSGGKLVGTPYYLPNGRVVVAGSWNKDARGWDLKVTPIMDADRSARFVQRRQVNHLFDDDLTVAVDPATGLLQTVNATSTDQTVNGLSSIVSSVAGVLSFGAQLGALPVGAAALDVDNDLAVALEKAVFSSFQIVVDQKTGVASAYVVSPDAANQRVYAKFTAKLTFPTDGTSHDRTVSPLAEPIDGIVVRLGVPCLLEISAKVFSLGGRSLAFSPRDIADLKSFATELTSPPDPNGISAHIFASLHPNTRALIVGYNGQSNPPLQHALAQDLNRLISGVNLYTPERFNGINLSQEALDLARSSPDGEDLNRLNQRLLLETYPTELSKTNDIYTMVPLEAPPSTIILPDAEREYVLSTPRVPFVSETTKVTLVNGMVQSMQEIRPSVILGVLGIPKTLIGAIVPIPLQIEQSQQNILESRAKSLAAEAAIREAESE